MEKNNEYETVERQQETTQISLKSMRANSLIVKKRNPWRDIIDYVLKEDGIREIVFVNST